MKSPRVTKRRVAHAAAFNEGARAIARKLGAQPDDFQPIEGEEVLVLNTHFGPMSIHPSTDPASVLDGLHHGCFFTVFCRFRAASRFREAHAQLGDNVNPYSGKHNFHCSAGNSDDDLQLVLQRFEQHLRATLPTEGTKP